VAVDRTTVIGLREAAAAFRQLEPIAREAFNEAVEKSSDFLVANARGRMGPGRGVRTGRLKESLGFSLNRRSGSAKVGIRSGFDVALPGRSALHRPTAIGHLVEFGHGGPHPAPAYPFLVPAAEATKSFFLAQSRAAGSVIERDMAKVGSHTL
jgi:hypothetical protein